MIKVGDYITNHTDFNHDRMIYDPTNRIYKGFDNIQEGAATSADAQCSIPNSSDFITSEDSEEQLYVYHLDGTRTALPLAGGDADTDDVAVSRDGSTIAFWSTTSDHVTLYQYPALTLIGRYDAGVNFTATRACVSLNANGSYISLAGWSRPASVLEVSSGSQLYNGGNYLVYSTIWNPVDGKLLLQLNNGIGVIDPSTWTQESNLADKPTGSTERSFALSPDNSKLCVLGTHNAVCYDTSDYSTIPMSIPASGSGQSQLCWRNDEELYLFHTYSKRVYLLRWDGSAFEAPVDKGYLLAQTRVKGDFARGAGWKIDGAITDNAEETDFVAIALLSDGRTEVGRTLIPSGTSAFSIPCTTQDPCMVLVRGVAQELHQTNKAYSVGDIIIVGDTIYSYECTTEGTTAGTKPAYPTSGSISDGGATFATRGKLSRPITNFPVYPVPV